MYENTAALLAQRQEQLPICTVLNYNGPWKALRALGSRFRTQPNDALMRELGVRGDPI